MSCSGWTSDEMVEQTGRVVIVTGANSGIGLEAARGFARKGATVILACRDKARGAEAAATILGDGPTGTIDVMALDLADLSSVRAFADTFHDRYDRLDLLINNAGVMMPPESRTVDGFELQFGTNHLGHFALTGLLLDLLRDTEGSRVVNVSSMAHRWGTIDFDDLQWEKRGYKKTAAYGQSKLANLLFTYELQRRFDVAGVDCLVVAAHPGWTGTNLQRTAKLFRAFNPVFAMKPWQGALPTLHAASADGVRGGDYFGPDGFQEMRGYPRRVESNTASHDPDTARRLWEVSEELTCVEYGLSGSTGTS